MYEYLILKSKTFREAQAYSYLLLKIKNFDEISFAARICPFYDEVIHNDKVCTSLQAKKNSVGQP